MQRYQYPESPEGMAMRSMLGGPAPEKDSYRESQFARVNALWGSNDLDKLSSGPTGVVPWPTAGKTKKGPNYDREAVREGLSQPVELTKTDPRMLHATQPSLTREGVDYYMGDDYDRTGRTFADQGNVGNRFPVVYRKSDGRNLLLSGHHRAAKALLRGEGFDARHIFGD